MKEFLLWLHQLLIDNPPLVYLGVFCCAAPVGLLIWPLWKWLARGKAPERGMARLDWADPPDIYATDAAFWMRWR